MPDDELPEPPQPPDVRRRIRLYPYQWVGLTVLSIIPALAVAGFFGESVRSERAERSGFDVLVTYPDRLRYQQLHRIEVRVLNGSGGAADTLRVSVDSALMRGFSSVTATPGFEQPWVLTLPDVRPGETRVAVIEMKAERYGRHDGTVSVSVAGREPSPVAHGGAGAPFEPIRIPVSIRTFP